MKLAITYDFEKATYTLLGGSTTREVNEADLRTMLGRVLPSNLKPTAVLAEARREGAVLVDCGQFTEGTSMRQRPATAQYRTQVPSMIERVLKGENPAAIIEALADIPSTDGVHIKCFFEGDDPNFSDANDVLITPGQNTGLDEIVAMYRKMMEHDAQLGARNAIKKALDGFEGPLPILYRMVQKEFARVTATSTHARQEPEAY
jgi:hypothetical protein